MAFPTLPSPSDFSKQLNKAQTRIPFESGVVQSAAKHTASRYIFSLGWKVLSTSNWALVVTHFDTYQGSVFTYTDPTSAVYSVRYQGDALPSARYLTTGFVEVLGLILEEA